MTKEVKLINQTDGPLGLRLVRATSKKFSGELRTVKEGQEYVLTVRTQPLPKGYHQGDFIFTTSLPQMPKYQMKARAHITDRIVVGPRRFLIFRPMRRAGEKFAFLRNQGEKPVHIIECTTSNDALKTRVETTTKGKSYRVVLEFPEGYVPSQAGDKLVIKTDDKEFPEFVVPIIKSKSTTTRPVRKRPVIRKAITGPAR